MPEFWIKMWEWWPEIFPVLLRATGMTIQVMIGALIVALILGLAVALMRISTFKLLRYPALFYTDVMRGTPALVQIFIIYFGLSDLGIEFDPVSAAIIGLGMNGAAYVGEIVPYAAEIKPRNVTFLYTPMDCAGCLGNCSRPLEAGMFACVAALESAAAVDAVGAILAAAP